MDQSLGTFGDLRLDKGGLRFSNEWLCARQYASAGWAAIAGVNCGLAGSSPAPR